MDEDRYSRELKLPDGKITYVILKGCKCRVDPEPFEVVNGQLHGKDCRRGPSGGVCGNCGEAIP